MYNALKGFEFDAIKKNAEMMRSNTARKSKDPKITYRDKYTTNIKSISSRISSPEFFSDSRASITTPESAPTYTFSKSARNPAFLKPSNSSENRFSYNPREIYPDPYELTHSMYITTNYSAKTAINFAKGIPRDNKQLYIKLSTPAVCTTKPTSCKNIHGISFNKMLSRNEFMGKSKSNDVQIAKNVDKIYLLTQKRVIGPNLNKLKPRYITDQALPSYMQNLNNRTSITALSFEMLKSNGYSGITENKTKPLVTKIRKVKKYSVIKNIKENQKLNRELFINDEQYNFI